ncbi:MAG: metallophosphoesterase family protein [Pseudomonadota bacterium]
MNRLSSLFNRKPTAPKSLADEDTAPPRGPEGAIIYAVGDIHGRDDLLTKMIDLIETDAARSGKKAATVVFLGDFVDRGMGSRAVIERLITRPPGDVDTIFLKGNHEEALLSFIADAPQNEQWLRFGGIETLQSYGISTELIERDIDEAREVFAQSFPATHRAFLNSLQFSHTVGDFYFCHAGIRPGVPLAAQAIDDLMWIREPFLSSSADHGKVIVHGHSITDDVEVRDNRIGLDIGAFASDRLACLRIEDDNLSFLYAEA